MTGQSYDWGWIFDEFSMKMNDNFHQTPIYMYVCIYIYICVCVFNGHVWLPKGNDEHRPQLMTHSKSSQNAHRTGTQCSKKGDAQWLQLSTNLTLHVDCALCKCGAIHWCPWLSTGFNCHCRNLHPKRDSIQIFPQINASDQTTSTFPPVPRNLHMKMLPLKLQETFSCVFLLWTWSH